MNDNIVPSKVPTMKPAKKRFPWALRLTLLAVVSPLFVVLASSAWETRHHGFDPLECFAGLVIPLATLAYIFIKGHWRLGLVTMLSCFVLYGFFGNNENERNDDQVKIDLRYPGPVGTEVYCNGVKIGEVPMEIRVGELKAKVPVWTAPPEQRWYVGGDVPVYTWIPWDHFIRTRYDARGILGDAEEIRRFDARSEFWWSFRYKGSTAIGCKTNNDVNSMDFDRTSFEASGALSLFFPTRYLLHDLLLAELRADSKGRKEWNPSPEWIDFTAHRGQLVDQFFEQLAPGVREIKSYDPLLNAVARKRHGLSQPATVEECERLLRDIVETEKTQSRSRFSTDHIYVYGLDSNNTAIFGESYICSDAILGRAIRQMGDACREPLLRYCREEFAKDDDYSPETHALLAVLKEYPFPEFFDEMVRFYAMQYKGFSTLTAFDDPRVVPLVATFLRQAPLFRDLSEGAKCQALLVVDNPLLEPLIRDYFARNLPEIRREENVSDLLQVFTINRLNPEKTPDRDELTRWIGKLRVKGTAKVAALEMLKTPPESDPDRIVLPIVNEDRELPWFSWQELVRRVKDAPADKEFSSIIAELLNDSDPEVVRMAIFQLAQTQRFLDEDADTEMVFRKICQEKGSWLNILVGMSNQFHLYSMETFTNHRNGRVTIQRAFQVPGSYVLVRQDNTYLSEQSPGTTIHQRIPRYFTDFFAELEKPEERLMAAPLLVYVAGPEAAALLESWKETDHKRLRAAVLSAQESHAARDAIRLHHRELFEKLHENKITPDDILPAASVFVWEGNDYVKKAVEEATQTSTDLHLHADN